MQLNLKSEQSQTAGLVIR